MLKAIIRFLYSWLPTEERPSPKARVKSFAFASEGLDVKFIKRISDTNSMDPTIDIGHKLIVIKPFELSNGDIIVFKHNNLHIVHRVTKIGKDDVGWYCKTKGDNAIPDSGKRRWKDIVYVVIGIIY